MQKNPSILVIDDEPDNFDVIETLLNSEIYDLHYAPNGRKGLEQLDIFQPDVILLDVMMPEIDGIEVCRRIKADPKWQAVPIIMVTALSAKEDLARCLSSGADDFISKPVNSLELRARVHSMLRIKQQYDSLQSFSHLQENTISLLRANLNDLRGNLVRALPHELNTPVNGIFGTIELLSEYYEDMSVEEIQELLEMARNSVLRLERLTQRFLSYLQLELNITDESTMNPIASEEEVIEVKSVITESAHTQAQNFQRLEDLSCHLEDTQVKANRKNLLCILEELLDNAFKFSEPGTPVKVAAKSANNTLHISISNKGRGMTEEQINKIGAFMQFERQTYEQQGLGLGLAIIKKMIALSGGTLAIRSHDNSEMTVQVTLPVSA
ncbi:hybrid sensor histidine kinase/response regulator [Calothrix sp. 336/3]|uniref:hybrid sensor histidine kinase/response regulator n=1 Tax=Calothrix sp. 336/3 TaxID=1337936 RepID=UPI0004E2BBD9|nr:hybrid sensor histidine kinase/response regulator [Calothrix sp. 336/3]AKG23539.1 histidine kinase [Calothrix sp. 336/3]